MTEVHEFPLTFDDRQILAEMVRRGMTFDTVRKRGRWKDLKKYQCDPPAYALDVMGMRLTREQESISFSVVENRRTACQACHAIGKCVILSDMITLADGTRLRAGDLLDRNFELLTLVDGVPTAVPAFARFNAWENVYDIITDTGKHVTRNAEHPFFVGRSTNVSGCRPAIMPLGFTPTSEILSGDLIAVAEELPAFGGGTLPDDEIKVLAYLLGDGGYAHGGIVFSQKGGRTLDEMMECVGRMGVKVVRNGKYDYSLRGTKRGSPGQNPVINLLRQHGMMGAHSREKRVPQCVFQFDRASLSLFLNRLFATDGWACVSETVGRRGKPATLRQIGFCSASQGLVEDVTYLLQKLGVHARVGRKSKVNAWTLTISDASDQMMFIERVGIFGKEEGLARIAELARPLRDRKRDFISRTPTRPRWCHKNAPLGTRWEKVVSVTSAGVEPTASITVPEHHTFLTQFWEHNTIIAGLLCNWWYDAWDEHIAYITAPTWSQALNLTFKQVKIARMKAGLTGTILENGWVRDPDPLRSPSHYIRALNSQSGEGFQGEHSAPIFMTFEEAVGIAPYIWAASDGLMTTKENRLLAIGNPTNETTEFGNACSNNAYNTIRVNGLDHPNVQAELAGHPQPFPGAVDLTFIYEMLLKETQSAEKLEGAVFEWHSLSSIESALKGTPIDPNSPKQLYMPNAACQGRVLGLFPTVADEQICPKGWLENSPGYPGSPLPARLLSSVAAGTVPSVGCDIAHGGADRTTIFCAWDAIALFGSELRQLDTVIVENACRTAARCGAEYLMNSRGEGQPVQTSTVITKEWIQEIAEWNERREVIAKQEIVIRIDVTGGLGNGPADHLADDGWYVQYVNSSSRAMMSGLYPNKRSELWFATRERAMAMEMDFSRLTPDIRQRLVKELSLPRYENDSKGRKVVDEKKTIKKNLKYSPDLADGWNLTIYDAMGGASSSSPQEYSLPPEASQQNDNEISLTEFDPRVSFDPNGLFIPPVRR
jgi:intein/homing endonuclease